MSAFAITRGRRAIDDGQRLFSDARYCQFGRNIQNPVPICHPSRSVVRPFLPRTQLFPFERKIRLLLGVRQSTVVRISSACGRSREVGDFRTGMVLTYSAVQVSDPVANDPVFDLEEVGEIRRSHVKPFVRGAEQESQLSGS